MKAIFFKSDIYSLISDGIATLDVYRLKIFTKGEFAFLLMT
jgi:hypothetical protein